MAAAEENGFDGIENGLVRGQWSLPAKGPERGAVWKEAGKAMEGRRWKK